MDDRREHILVAEPTAAEGLPPPFDREEIAGLVRMVDRIVETGVDLYGRHPSRIVRRPDEVKAAARLVLAAALALKAQLDGLGLLPRVDREVASREGGRR